MKPVLPPPPTPAEIASVLELLSRADVAVLGDFCLDAYWMIDRSASEASVETGLSTEPVRRQRYSPGGAGNVVMNLLDLGVRRIFPVGVVGADPFGRELRRLLDHPRIDPDALLTQEDDWATHGYVKPYADGQEGNRIDTGNFNRLSPETGGRLFAALEEIVAKVAVVLINHQSIGSLHDDPTFRDRLDRLIRNHPKTCFIVDSRRYHDSYPAAMHKLNEREVMHSGGASVDEGVPVPLEDLLDHAGRLSARWNSPLVITRGARGCLVYAEKSVTQIFGLQLPGRIDAVGAGDTFVSTLAGALAAGAGLTVSASVANLAAAVTAQKLFQTGTATPGEILQLGSHAEYACHPELAGSAHRARYFEHSEIEIVTGLPPAPPIRHAIFDHDGTISTLREGWEHIMEPVMLEAVLGPHLATAGEALYLRAQTRVRDFIERTTGIQTITQMHGLVELVREFGLVPEVLTAAEYKAVYNVKLKEMVHRRLAKLDNGELAIDDFTLKGAVPFLHALHRAGVRLYLASGTDQDDVRQEAERLGYADLFAGGIHGSIGNVDQDAKKIVLERILREAGGSGGQLAAFGDGPVEMREAVRRGAWAVGIASDELRRFGLNEGKRSRLIRAGAQLVAPDFSQWKTLWRLLGLPGEH